MSAPVADPPALERNPEEEQRSLQDLGHILAQLSAALESPDIKVLKWSEDGRNVLVHAELYKEEMEKNKQLFPKLADLSDVAELKAWLLAYGFKLKRAKLNSQVLLLQHPDFQRAHSTVKETGALSADLSAKHQKKKRQESHLLPLGGATSDDKLGKRPRLRNLYQYIDQGMPELSDLSAAEEAPALPQQSQDPAAPGSAAAQQMEDTGASSAPEIPVLGSR
ncbi:uncharacterized protein LOC134165004 [Pezoporus occidentalis]|uniref:uncharacterized protein LOC134165004 n=1 Tax=Pezoporus occidentalis TaxID=407982 RepID=UPI002F91AC9E